MKRILPLCSPAALAVAAALTLTTAVDAQGSDSCATPTVASGGTTFAFNNSTATTGSEGQTNSSCNQFGSTAVQRDVWFTWVGPTTGTYTFATCGGTSVDTKIAVYDGNACPTATALSCNEIGRAHV